MKACVRHKQLNVGVKRNHIAREGVNKNVQEPTPAYHNCTGATPGNAGISGPKRRSVMIIFESVEGEVRKPRYAHVKVFKICSHADMTDLQRRCNAVHFAWY